ncbi:FAD-dependent hydroxylase [Arthrospira platensis]|jgi:2-octaprenyl-6-methoxyphenol hydroxylase|uniref:2-octaprenyl-6-methoxyphenol 4-monooxygenase UbiH n=1 Tax=Limnospira platensis NIES-46 TaxID=1236695 RepID=A0A5M3T4P6_LIMPL|nr:FAD-dependent hydroxylase [Arthrospira platensis]AMW26782.1 2-octaprenyl-6-methoxyphenyl hydroxylase [Arthrospira platensis YZ]KDR58234.1 2-octaprenyl-6-methoxyphenyl hydroxylase [Arthrospira platensis str. Paraca]MBD2669561.1 FAD-dependent hydroxylase [Arthrospira platensis FACHB-439]MBD2712161.1 FAD-dependent hydroxylase [Arthrospira platensis FACHB-835]MDF2211845.1 FAD-dependent hydroxylase [Arthrospira platensis NCB002]MDT9184425.1 FAD-dependent hydroxylase [Limnospira sp. PMC 289.06]
MGVSELLAAESIIAESVKGEGDYDIAIVGGGIVGATVACSLKNSGLRIALIEPQPKAIAASRRQAYALTLQTGRILDQIGVWGDILPKITTFYQISLSDNDHPNVINFETTDLGTEALGYVGEHSVILTAMQRFLEDCAEVHWWCPGRVKQVSYYSDRAEIEVETGEEVKTIKARLVMAADGAKSPLREACGINTKGWKYWQSCIAFTIQTEKHHNNVAFEKFWSSGPMGVLPLPGNRCQVVLTAPHSQAHEWQKMDKGEFLELLEYRTGGVLGRLELLSDRIVFPVQLMQSDRYVNHRLALVGDAAHCCHPVGGQGLNMGIRDAGAIAEIVKKAYQAGEDIGDLKTLNRYQKWRRGENLLILGFTDFLDRMFSGNWRPQVILRRWGLWGLKKIRPLRYLSLRIMTGLFGRAPQITECK